MMWKRVDILDMVISDTQFQLWAQEPKPIGCLNHLFVSANEQKEVAFEELYRTKNVC